LLNARSIINFKAFVVPLTALDIGPAVTESMMSFLGSVDVVLGAGAITAWVDYRGVGTRLTQGVGQANTQQAPLLDRPDTDTTTCHSAAAEPLFSGNRLMSKMRRLLGLGAGLALALSTGLAGAADKPTLKIGYVDGWSDSVATTHVAAEIIKEKLGYDVQLMPVATGIMWQGVAKGQLDAMLSAWLPVTHGAYYEKMKARTSTTRKSA
jgi:hypothetical protein